MPFTFERKSIFASLPRTERARSFVLGGDPKGKTFLYTHDINVYIRDLENPAICDVYHDHSVQTSVAKYAPSGFYIASGDASGKLKIWDTTQKEHLTKYEYQPLSGKINDIAWSPDSKRIAVCGNGREKYAAVILWDTGTRVGELTANSKNCNAIDYKPTRPFRIVVASEDMTTAFYEGPPFKTSKVYREHHSSFVNATRFSPDGNFFATGGTDAKVLVYTGKDGEFSFELKDGDKAHKGGVYGVCFSPDSTQILSASGDKTVKLWDVATQQIITTFTMGTQLEDQQLSTLWQGDYILSASLSGYINYLDKNNPGKPLRIIRGHNKNIASFALSDDKKTIYSSGLEQKVLCFDADTGECEVAAGKPHNSMVMGMTTNGNVVASVGMDDKIRFLDTEKNEFTDDVIGLDKQPLSISSASDMTAVGTVEGICLFKGKTQTATADTSYEAKAVSLSPSGSQLAVGGSDKKVHIFDVSSGELKEIDQLTTNDPVSTVQFSPSGQYLACAHGRQVQLWIVEGFTPSKTEWSGHFARVITLNWSPDSKRIATGGVEGSIGVWDVSKPKENNIISGAHPKAVITSVAWRDDTTIVSASQDKCIKQWVV